MNFAAFIPVWLDAFLIAPFRWPSVAIWGMWLGSAFLAFYCIILGEIVSTVLSFVHHKYYNSMHDDMIRHHNTSVAALHAGNKEAYLAANSLAQDSFGKSFFAEASIGIASLWPVPFALAWLSLRFEGIILYTFPYTNIHMGYVFVLLILYIPGRIVFARHKKHLPFFATVYRMKQEARASRTEARPLFIR